MFQGLTGENRAQTKSDGKETSGCFPWVYPIPLNRLCSIAVSSEARLELVDGLGDARLEEKSSLYPEAPGGRADAQLAATVTSTTLPLRYTVLDLILSAPQSKRSISSTRPITTALV